MQLRRSRGSFLVPTHRLVYPVLGFVFAVLGLATYFLPQLLSEPASADWRLWANTLVFLSLASVCLYLSYRVVTDYSLRIVGQGWKGETSLRPGEVLQVRRMYNLHGKGLGLRVESRVPQAVLPKVRSFTLHPSQVLKVTFTARLSALDSGRELDVSERQWSQGYNAFGRAILPVEDRPLPWEVILPAKHDEECSLSLSFVIDKRAAVVADEVLDIKMFLSVLRTPLQDDSSGQPSISDAVMEKVGLVRS